MAFVGRSGATLLIALVGCASEAQVLPGPDDPETGPRESGTVLPFDAADFDVAYDAGLDANMTLPEGGGPVDCTMSPDGTLCTSAPDDCHTGGLCSSGTCMAPAARPDGYNWKAGDDYARCCSGSPLVVDTDSNCGACGIVCNASNGESCSILGGRYFCRGCKASSACWSKCCSTSFSPNSCAASDCKGGCDSTYCPSGSHCAVGGGISSDYCAY